MVDHTEVKAAKEAFVTGLSGTSKAEIFALVSTLSLSIVLCAHFKRKHFPWSSLGLEMLLIIYPQLLICTGALPLHPTLLVLLLVVSVYCGWDAIRPDRAARQDLPPLDDLAGRRKSFVGLFRGALMAATCLAILAVDFRAFPRRYAKAEAYGTGYMDVGVGGVIFTAGLVSPASCPEDPDGSDSPGPDSNGGAGGKGAAARRRWRAPLPLWRRLLVGLRGAAACWVLGLARLVSTRAVDYQEHVGEYGVHWNFFDTIAVVALLGHAVALPPDLLVPAAVAVTAGHQAALTRGGLGPWVMSPERGTDFLSLNKEGLVSCTGFWAIYLWGAALAYLMHVTVQPAVRHLRRGGARVAAPSATAWCGVGSSAVGAVGAEGRRKEQQEEEGGAVAAVDGSVVAAAAPLVRWWLQLAALDGLMWVAVAVLETRVERISRRSCNGAYILWIAAQCLAGMLPLALWQALATAAGAVSRGGPGGWDGHDTRAGRLGVAGPRVLQAINSNQLAVFLAANLLTGAVNLSINTLEVADWPARALLAVYITFVCGLALLLDGRRLRIKL